jgi:hypothetical protein
LKNDAWCHFSLTPTPLSFHLKLLHNKNIIQCHILTHEKYQIKIRFFFWRKLMSSTVISFVSMQKYLIFSWWEENDSNRKTKEHHLMTMTDCGSWVNWEWEENRKTRMSGALNGMSGIKKEVKAILNLLYYHLSTQLRVNVTRKRRRKYSILY